MKMRFSAVAFVTALAYCFNPLFALGKDAEGARQSDVAQTVSSGGSSSGPLSDADLSPDVVAIPATPPAILPDALPVARVPDGSPADVVDSNAKADRKLRADVAFENEKIGFVELREEKERASRELKGIRFSYNKEVADVKLDAMRKIAQLEVDSFKDTRSALLRSREKARKIFKKRGLYKKNIVTVDFGMQYVYAELGAYNDMNYVLHAGGVIGGMGLNPETTFFSLSGALSYTRLLSKEIFISAGVSTRGSNDSLLTDPKGIKSNFSSTSVNIMVGRVLLDSGKFSIRVAAGLIGSAVYIDPVSDRNIVRGADAAEQGKLYDGGKLEWYKNDNGALYPYDPKAGDPGVGGDLSRTTGGFDGKHGAGTVTGNIVHVGGAVDHYQQRATGQPDPYLKQIGSTYTLGVGVGVGVDLLFRPTERQSVTVGLKYSVGPDYLHYAQRGSLGYSMYGAFDLVHNITLSEEIDVYYKAGLGVQYIEDVGTKFFLTYFLDAFVSFNVGLSYKF